MEDDKVADFKVKFFEVLEDPEIKSAVDERDVKRINDVDRYAMCFINWRKGDVDSAVSLATDVLKWRKERDIYGTVAEDLDQVVLQRGVIFSHGKASDDTRVVYFVARHQTKEIKPQVQRIMCLWLERLQQQELGQHITFLLDVSKSSMSNVDLGGIKFLLECFTQYFPDMLERIIILEMPWIMNAIWKIVKQWMTEEQRKKTVFCNFKALPQYISPENILTYMGGQDTWKYNYPPDDDVVPNIFLQTDFNSSPNHVPSENCESIQDESVNEEEYVMDDVEITTSEIPSFPGSEVTVPSTEKVDSEKATSQSTSIPSTFQTAGADLKPTSAAANGHLASEIPQMSEKQQRHPVISVSQESPSLDAEVIRRPYGVDKDIQRGNKQSFQTTKTTASNEINLKSLLLMRPIAEVVFQESVKDVKSGRYQSVITLTNPNENINVAFKVKTNSPERYHVKPSTGCVRPGEELTIRINLSPGHEESVSNDRFLILYQKKEDDVDIAEFWKNHLKREMRFEHRVRARFHLQPSPGSEFSQSSISPNVSRTHTADLQAISPMPVAAAHLSSSTSSEEQLEKLSRDISGLKAKLLLSEYETARFRTKFQYSLFLQGGLLLLLLYVIYNLSLITAILELGLSLKKV